MRAALAWQWLQGRRALALVCLKLALWELPVWEQLADGHAGWLCLLCWRTPAAAAAAFALLLALLLGLCSVPCGVAVYSGIVLLSYGAVCASVGAGAGGNSSGGVC